jgi:hypothetical protein
MPAPHKAQRPLLIAILVAAVVIGLLLCGWLVGHLMVGYRAIQATARQTQSKVLATQIAVCFTYYKTIYGAWHTNAANALLFDRSILAMLQGKDPTNNPSNTVFIDISPKLLDRNGNIADRWGRPYWYLLDQDGDGLVADPLTPGNVVTNPVLVWATDTNYPAVKSW